MDKDEEKFKEKWNKIRITIWNSFLIATVLSIIGIVFLPGNYKVTSFLPILIIYFVSESILFCPKCNKKIIYSSKSCKFCGIMLR
jgi:hypothetical protein